MGRDGLFADLPRDALIGNDLVNLPHHESGSDGAAHRQADIKIEIELRHVIRSFEEIFRECAADQSLLAALLPHNLRPRWKQNLPARRGQSGAESVC